MKTYRRSSWNKYQDQPFSTYVEGRDQREKQYKRSRKRKRKGGEHSGVKLVTRLEKEQTSSDFAEDDFFFMNLFSFSFSNHLNPF